MEKKLTSQGPRGRESYTLTLPKEWVLENKLDKTKLIDLEIVGGKIILSTEKKVPEIKLDLFTYERTLKRILPILYRKGVSRIEIKTDRREHIDEVYKIIRDQLFGFEVIEHTEKKIAIEYIMQESEDALKSTIRRIFLLVADFPNISNPKQIKNLEKNIQRLINYCQRILLKKGYQEYTELPDYYLLLDRLDKINDEFSELLVLKLNQNQKKQLKEIQNLFQKIYELFYKFDKNDFEKYSEKSYKLFKKIANISQKEQGMVHLYNIARATSSLCGTVFALKF